jgi:hypothetical protein
MIDNLAILISTIMILYVLLQAIRLNRTMPWFPRASRPPSGLPRPATHGPSPERPPSAPARPSRGRDRWAGR